MENDNKNYDLRMSDNASPSMPEKSGVCCGICHMGLCRITPEAPRGICGADADTIVARTLLREVASGTASHSDQARHLVLMLKKAAEDHQIKDTRALLHAARLYGVECEGRGDDEIALELAHLFLQEFSSQEQPLKTLELAPQKRQSIWETKHIKPFGIDRTVVEALHRMGVDHDYKSLLMHAFRTSLAAGWGGARVACMASDILFGTPAPVRSVPNPGDVRLDTVNVLIHGHKPALPDMLTAAAASPEVMDYAKAAPSDIEPLITGFSVDAIKYMLGGKFRASLRPLNDAIIQNRILGIAGIVGCDSQKADDYVNVLAKGLIKRNIIVLITGSAAIAAMLKPEIALEMAGDGLREVCEAVGAPPILHMGGCDDNARILETATELVKEGGLGDDLSMLPAVGVAPECVSEKAIAIGCYFVASGIDVVLGNPFSTEGSQNVTDFLQDGAREDFGACFHPIQDPLEAVDRIEALLNEKRDRLGINKKAERKLLDMKDRRDM